MIGEVDGMTDLFTR